MLWPVQIATAGQRRSVLSCSAVASNMPKLHMSAHCSSIRCTAEVPDKDRHRARISKLMSYHGMFLHNSQLGKGPVMALTKCLYMHLVASIWHRLQCPPEGSDQQCLAVQGSESGSLARCKQLFEVAAALRNSLYARAQSLQLLQAPFAVEALDMSLFRQPDDPAPAAAAGKKW